jgi:eukaryotic-like serine/threonine-protein kinase
MSHTPPQTLGQYQIIREIARSNDIVYEAYDPLMNRRVAIKELAMPRGVAPHQQEDRLNRFKREAQAAGTLNHPNIMTVFSFGEENGRHFMALEYLDGHTLRNEIDTRGALPVDRAVEIAIEVLEGLNHAHERGVVHRDIKPDNIQILSSGAIKITDFGIARLTFQPNLTMDGQVFGTPSYMSPEQIVGREIDARSDLFSVGVMLYEMIAGQKPFIGDSVVSISYAIMNTEPSQPAQCNYALWQVIARALDKSSNLRHSSAQEMADALRGAQRAAQSDVLDPAPNPYAPIPPPIQTTGAYSSAPPPVYGYNPYAPPPPQTVPPGHYPPPGQPTGYPQGPIPVYYPPPPRQPLMKPDTRVFLGKLMLTFVILGTMFALIVVGVGELVNAVHRYQAEQEDRKHTSAIIEDDPSIPIHERIRMAEERKAQLRSEPNIRAAERSIAALYEQKGQAELAQGDFAKAEYSFSEALARDPGNPALLTNMASIYERRAQAASEPSMQESLWHTSADHWAMAARHEPDAAVKATYLRAAAVAKYRQALSAAASGQYPRHEIRQMLYQARAMAGSDAVLLRNIDELMARLR